MKHKVFDVAKWTTEDIESLMGELNIEVKPEDLETFIEIVVDVLSDNFDASQGINLNTIECAILEVNEEFYSDLEEACIS